MEYQIVRSKRKTVAIEVKEDKLIIKCPYRCSKEYIDSLISKNQQWIEETHKKLITRKNSKLQYRNGQNIYYIGHPYEITIANGTRNSIQFSSEKFIFKIMDLENKKEEEIDFLAKELQFMWFKKHGTAYLTKRTLELADILELKVNKVYIKNVKTIWGSCSSKNNINYNIRLISMPKEIIDYVIVHELCHLVQRNHSDKFWALVENIMPDYKSRRAFLKNESSKYCNW